MDSWDEFMASNLLEELHRGSPLQRPWSRYSRIYLCMHDPQIENLDVPYHEVKRFSKSHFVGIGAIQIEREEGRVFLINGRVTDKKRQPLLARCMSLFFLSHQVSSTRRKAVESFPIWRLEVNSVQKIGCLWAPKYVVTCEDPFGFLCVQNFQIENHFQHFPFRTFDPTTIPEWVHPPSQPPASTTSRWSFSTFTNDSKRSG